MDQDRIIKVFNDGKEVEIYIKDLSLQEREEAESVRIKKWNQAIQNKAVFAEKLNAVLEEQGIWNDEKETKISELRLEVAEYLDAIDKGGIKLSEAKKLAMKIKDLRNKITILAANRIRYINETVEGQAQNAEFDYLTSQSAVYNDDRSKKYFASYEDFLNRKNHIDAYTISSKVAEILYGGGEEAWPENVFLKKYKFVDEKLRLINKEGHLIDEDGRLIDDMGNYISYDKKGNKIFVDNKGNPVITSLERKPFLDDDGKPIAV